MRRPGRDRELAARRSRGSALSRPRRAAPRGPPVQPQDLDALAGCATTSGSARRLDKMDEPTRKICSTRTASRAEAEEDAGETKTAGEKDEVHWRRADRAGHERLRRRRHPAEVGLSGCPGRRTSPGMRPGSKEMLKQATSTCSAPRRRLHATTWRGPLLPSASWLPSSDDEPGWPAGFTEHRRWKSRQRRERKQNRSSPADQGASQPPLLQQEQPSKSARGSSLRPGRGRATGPSRRRRSAGWTPGASATAELLALK